MDDSKPAKAVKGPKPPRVKKPPLTDEEKAAKAAEYAAQPRHITPQEKFFFDHYKHQLKDCFVEEGEYEAMAKALKSPLPLAFRINENCPYPERIKERLRGELQFEAGKHEFEGALLGPPRCMPWYPGDNGWSADVSRPALRKIARTLPAMKALHDFLKTETNTGSITRQEAVSMVPPLLLDCQPDHRVLDMCASPGSKTSQILEALIKGNGTGFAIANDLDVKRGYMLCHQLHRLPGQQLVVSCHNAVQFPQIPAVPEGSAPCTGSFDRVLCDVPCSGDGTVRKAPEVLRHWHAGNALTLHALQLDIALRGLQLLRPGGRLVYSTCSLNCVENEAVVGAILDACGDSVEVVDVSGELVGLKRHPGMANWPVGWQRKGGKQRADLKAGLVEKQNLDWFNTFAEVPPKLHNGRMLPTMFANTAAGSDRAKQLAKCLRLLPHDNDSGGFFVCVLRRKESAVALPEEVRPGFCARRMAEMRLSDKTASTLMNAEQDAAAAAAAAAAGEEPPAKRKKWDGVDRSGTEEDGGGGAAAAKTEEGRAAAAEKQLHMHNTSRVKAREEKQQSVQEKKKKARGDKKSPEEAEADGLFRGISDSDCHSLHEFFGIPAGRIARECLCTRSSKDGGNVWLVRPEVLQACVGDDIIAPGQEPAPGTKPLLSVVVTGTRLFAKVSNRHTKKRGDGAEGVEGAEGAEAEPAGAEAVAAHASWTQQEGVLAYRPAQEGLHVLLPMLRRGDRRRLVHISFDDLMLMLKYAAGEPSTTEVVDAERAVDAAAAAAAAEAAGVPLKVTVQDAVADPNSKRQKHMAKKRENVERGGAVFTPAKGGGDGGGPRLLPSRMLGAGGAASLDVLLESGGGPGAGVCALDPEDTTPEATKLRAALESEDER